MESTKYSVKNRVGIHLLDSAVTGNFAPVSSDIDFLVVTARPPDENQSKKLAALHRRLA